jgi:Membrane proteins related to metalloendopeptidases
MPQVKKLDRQLLVYLDKHYGHLLSPTHAQVRLPAVSSVFRSDIASVDRLDRLTLLTAPSAPPMQMLLLSIEGISPSSLPQSIDPNSIAEVRSLRSVHKTLQCSSLPVGIARVDPSKDPHERDPSAHPGFDQLPSHWQYFYTFVGQLRVGFSSIALSADGNSRVYRYFPLALIVLALVISLSEAPGQGSSQPDTAEKQRLSSIKDSLKTTAEVSKLQAHRTALQHFPARPPIADSLLEVSSEYGWRKDPMTGDPTVHGGVDLAAPKSTPVVAPGRGVVQEVGRGSRSGKYVLLDHSPMPFESSFSHLSKAHVEKGDSVSVGDKIASVGATGRITGPHLHFRIDQDGTPVDPAALYRRYLALRDSFSAQATRTRKNLDRAIRTARSHPDSISPLVIKSMMALRSDLRPLFSLPEPPATSRSR